MLQSPDVVCAFSVCRRTCISLNIVTVTVAGIVITVAAAYVAYETNASQHLALDSLLLYS